jgi:hypothetical protein
MVYSLSFLFYDCTSLDIFTNPDPVFDLPTMIEEPSYDDLLEVMAKMKVKPSSWTSRAANKPDTEQEAKRLARYLTSVISNDLKWLEHDAQRERIWEIASKRLAERCGRTGK